MRLSHYILKQFCLQKTNKILRSSFILTVQVNMGFVFIQDGIDYCISDLLLSDRSPKPQWLQTSAYPRTRCGLGIWRQRSYWWCEKLSFIGESGGRILFQDGKLKLLARDWTLHLIDPHPNKAPRVSPWHSSWLLSYTDIKSKDRWRRNIPSHPSHGSYIPPPPGILVRYTAIQCGRGVCKPQNSMRCECWSLLQRLSQKWST